MYTDMSTFEGISLSFYLVVLRIKLRALCLLGRWSHAPVLIIKF
jgi:hypothetical protein